MEKFVLMLQHKNNDEYVVRHKIKGNLDLCLIAKSINVFLENVYNDIHEKDHRYTKKDIKEWFLFLFLNEAQLDEAFHLTNDYFKKRSCEWEISCSKKESFLIKIKKFFGIHNN